MIYRSYENIVDIFISTLLSYHSGLEFSIMEAESIYLISIHPYQHSLNNRKQNQQSNENNRTTVKIVKIRASEWVGYCNYGCSFLIPSI